MSSTILGIIAEYNPFHNGHKYHLEESKAKVKPDYTVAVISGMFTQRGEPAILNKWERTKLALENGIDLVIELPCIYSVSSAENFALGSIKILNEINTNYISFGSEADLVTLENIADTLVKNDKHFNKLLKEKLSTGVSYPAALTESLSIILEEDLSDILRGSNNILGIEYLKAIKNTKSKIRPIAIKRDVSHLDNKINGKIASGTAIREAIINKDINSTYKVLPENTFNVLKEHYKEGSLILGLNAYSKEIFYKLRTMSIEDLQNVPDVTEGLENNLKKYANATNDLGELLELLKSKRYTYTRLERILTSILLGITKEDVINSKKQIPYVRVLGFNENGKNLLSEISKPSKNKFKSKHKLKVITSLKQFEEENNLNSFKERMLKIDKRATDIYTLAYPKDSKGNLDYTTKIIKV